MSFLKAFSPFLSLKVRKKDSSCKQETNQQKTTAAYNNVKALVETLKCPGAAPFNQAALIEN